MMNPLLASGVIVPVPEVMTGAAKETEETRAIKMGDNLKELFVRKICAVQQPFRWRGY